MLAGLLLLVGLYVAGRRVAKEHHKLAVALDEIDRIVGDTSLSTEEQTGAARKILEPQFNYGRLAYNYEWIQRLILRDALDDLRRPVVLTGLAIVCGTAANLLSLLLPSS